MDTLSPLLLTMETTATSSYLLPLSTLLLPLALALRTNSSNSIAHGLLPQLVLSFVSVSAVGF
jgi:hypothetical protein